MEPAHALNHAEGARILQEQIISAIGTIDLPAGLNVPNDEIISLIQQNFDASNIDKLNDELRIIESDAKYKGIKADGSQAFELFVQWWVDYYWMDTKKKKNQFGWSIALNGGRVRGPGHVVLPDDQPLKFFRVIEVSAVINDDLEVKKSIPVGEDGARLEVEICQCEYDEEEYGQLEREREDSDDEA